MDRKALARATDSSDAPPPGYLFLDIAKSSALSPKACQDTVQYLMKRLQNKNHNIKYKTLKVISKVSENPATRGQFKREISANAQFVGLIRDASTFRGPPDPLRGMAIYEQVHEAAKEALAAIYSETTSGGNEGMGAPGLGTSYGAPVGGYSGGASAYGGASSGGGDSMGTGTKMEGIGNPMFPDPRNAPQAAPRGIANMTVTEVMSSVGETVVNMVKDPLARNIPTGNIGGYGNQGGGPPGRSALSIATGGRWTMASNRGPNAVSAPGMGYNPDRDAYQREQTPTNNGGSSFGWAQKPTTTNQSPVRGGVGGTWGSSGGGVAGAARESHFGSNHYSNGGQSFGGSGGTAVSDGSYERNLIMELCPAGGMKAEPPPDKLEQFARSVPSLNADLVCPALLDNLEDGTPWIVKAKALCVIDRTIKATNHMEPNPYADFFYACGEEITPLASHTRAAIREPAKRVLQELGLELPATEVPSAPEPKAAAPMSAPAPHVEADLLDFGGAPVPPPPVAAPPAPETPEKPAAPVGGSLFGGLTIQQPAPSMPAPSANPPPPAQEENLLGGFSPDTSGVPAPAAPPASDPVDLFGNMSIKENIPAPTGGAGMSSAPAGGSAFSFMNGAASVPAAPESSEARDQPAMNTTPPKQDSFDPLLSLDWSNKSAQQNKLQAIAAEHSKMMMMQQQQQQAQMHQMMMQQQAGGMGMPNGYNPAYMNMPSPTRGNVMGGNTMKQIPILGHNPQQQNANNTNAFSFLRDDVAEKKKQQEHSFDFIKDALKTKK